MAATMAPTMIKTIVALGVLLAAVVSVQRIGRGRAGGVEQVARRVDQVRDEVANLDEVAARRSIADGSVGWIADADDNGRMRRPCGRGVGAGCAEFAGLSRFRQRM